jgi:hypothetical protein
MGGVGLVFDGFLQVARLSVVGIVTPVIPPAAALDGRQIFVPEIVSLGYRSRESGTYQASSNFTHLFDSGHPAPMEPSPPYVTQVSRAIRLFSVALIEKGAA